MIFGGNDVDVVNGNQGADLIYNGCDDDVTLANEDILVGCND